MEEKESMVSRENTLPSIRNLVDSDIGPLRRFTGALDSISSEPQKYNEGKPDEKSSTKLSLNYKEIEVVELDEMHTYIGSKKTIVGSGLLLIDLGKDLSTSLLATGVPRQVDYYGKR